MRPSGQVERDARMGHLARLDADVAVAFEWSGFCCPLFTDLVNCIELAPRVVDVIVQLECHLSNPIL